LWLANVQKYNIEPFADIPGTLSRGIDPDNSYFKYLITLELTSPKKSN
jgi:hypothetical protein